MPYYYYGFDWTYIVLVLPCLILSLWASAKVNSTFKKYSQQRTLRGLTAQEAAMRVLSANGVSGVRIERVSGNLTDHYDPRANVIRLSDSVYDNTSTAAIGVALPRGRSCSPVRSGLRPHQASGGHHSCDEHRLQAGHAPDFAGHPVFRPGPVL